MEITTEILKSVYLMANEYCKARHGFEPEKIELEEDGTLHCYDTDYDGDRRNHAYIAPETLTTDLIEAAEQRRIEKEEADKKEAERRKAYEAAKIQEDKERRFREYKKLKKEFE